MLISDHNSFEKTLIDSCNTSYSPIIGYQQLKFNGLVALFPLFNLEIYTKFHSNFFCYLDNKLFYHWKCTILKIFQLNKQHFECLKTH